MTLKPNPLEFSAVPVSPSSAEKSRFSTEMENPKREKQRRPWWLNVFFIPLQRAFSVENCLLRCPVKRDPQEDLPGISYHIIHDERRNVLCVVYHQQRSNFRSWLTRIPTSAWDIPHLYIYTEKKVMSRTFCSSARHHFCTILVLGSPRRKWNEQKLPICFQFQSLKKC